MGFVVVGLSIVAVDIIVVGHIAVELLVIVVAHLVHCESLNHYP